LKIAMEPGREKFMQLTADELAVRLDAVMKTAPTSRDAAPESTLPWPSDMTPEEALREYRSNASKHSELVSELARNDERRYELSRLASKKAREEISRLLASRESLIAERDALLKRNEEIQERAREAPPSAPAPAEPAAPAVIEDFGEKIGGARKDQVASVDREITDDDLANMTFSEIWPKAEVDAIEDLDVAAVATAIRNEVPAKPRKGYKVKRWVETVKLVRGLMKHVNENGFDSIMKRFREGPEKLGHFADKIDLLRQLPREQWDRIGKVENRPDAYRYEPAKEGDEGAKKSFTMSGEKWFKQVPTPHATAEVDGRYVRADTLADLPAAVSERLGVQSESAAMQFEIRGKRDGSEMQINKKGDSLYRTLKKFTGKDAVQQARDFIKNNRADLVTA